MLDLNWVLWSIYFPGEKYLYAIWRQCLSIDSLNSHGYKLCTAYSRFVIILLPEDFHKFKKLDFVDVLNGTSRYIDDLLTIDNIEFENVLASLIYIRQNCNWTKKIHVKNKRNPSL